MGKAVSLQRSTAGDGAGFRSGVFAQSVPAIHEGVAQWSAITRGLAVCS